MVSEKYFKSFDGTNLDIIIHAPEKPKACLILYPCIGGNTRTYMVPTEFFLSRGITVIQYNPRTHGESEGQMSMEVALKDLYYYLAINNYYNYPIIAVGHSAGCNAILQLDPLILNIRRYFLVEPVLYFRESMYFMYKKNTYSEFINAVSKWVTDKEKLHNILSNDLWLDIKYWHSNSIRQEIDLMCSSFKLGKFLENFYIPGFNTFSQFSSYKDKIHVFLARRDNWYPLDTLQYLVKKHKISYTIIEKAIDHFFFMAWKEVWDKVITELY